jgi:hypothetical protein
VFVSYSIVVPTEIQMSQCSQVGQICERVAGAQGAFSEEFIIPPHVAELFQLLELG